MNEEPTATRESPLAILVVDDDELNQRMMRLILKREGHLVEAAFNGLDAVEAVKSKRFDIILMDLQMPEMDGVEASRRIRELENGKGRTFIVALTASYLPEKGRELFEAGIDNYMAKPFEVAHLRNILQHGLERRTSGAVLEMDQPVSELPVLEQPEDLYFRFGIERVGGNYVFYKEFFRYFVDELPDKL